MANKKINELDSRSSLSLSDLMAVGDPSTGYLYKTTISDLKTLTGAGVISFNGRFGAVVPVEGDYALTQLSDVIITSASNGQVLKYNGSNWVNAAEAAETDTLDSVTDRGNTTTNGITVGSIVAGTTAAQAYHAFYSSNVNDGNTVTIAAENTSANSSRSQLLLTDTSGGASKRFGLGVYTGASPYSYLDAATKLVLQQSGGNVIIGGITDAGYKLDVVGGFRSALSAGHFVHLDPVNYRYLVNVSNTQTLQDSENITFTVNGSGVIALQTALVNRLVVNNNGTLTLSSLAGTGSRIVTADANGVLSASTTLSGYVPYTGATANVDLGGYSLSLGTVGTTATTNINVYGTLSNYVNAETVACAVRMSPESIKLVDKQFGGSLTLVLRPSGLTTGNNYGIAFPAASGTVALTSNLSSYLPLAGGTLTGALSGTSATFSTFLGVGASTQRDPSGTRSLTISGVSSGYAASLDLYATRNYAIYSGGGGQLGFYDLTAGAERLTIDSSGAATFSSSVTARLGMTIYGAAGGYTTGDNPFFGLGSTAADTFGAINAPYGDKMKLNSYHGFEFKTSNAGASGTPVTKATITTEGYLRLASNGIQFNGDTSDSNSLDDYEEGTWTPNLVGGVSGEATYLTRQAWYTKVGRVVTITWFISFTKNTMSGTFRITGFPFALLNGSGVFYPQGTILLDGLSTTTNNITIQGANSTASGDFIGGNGTTGTHTGLPISVLGSGTMECRGTLTYFT